MHLNRELEHWIILASWNISSTCQVLSTKQSDVQVKNTTTQKWTQFSANSFRVKLLKNQVTANQHGYCSNRVGVIRTFRNKNFSFNTFHEEYLVIRTLREWNLKQQERSVIMTLKNKNVYLQERCVTFFHDLGLKIWTFLFLNVILPKRPYSRTLLMWYYLVPVLVTNPKRSKVVSPNNRLRFQKQDWGSRSSLFGSTR